MQEHAPTSITTSTDADSALLADAAVEFVFHAHTPKAQSPDYLGDPQGTMEQRRQAVPRRDRHLVWLRRRITSRSVDMSKLLGTQNSPHLGRKHQLQADVEECVRGFRLPWRTLFDGARKAMTGRWVAQRLSRSLPCHLQRFFVGVGTLSSWMTSVFVGGLRHEAPQHKANVIVQTKIVVAQMIVILKMGR